MYYIEKEYTSQTQCKNQPIFPQRKLIKIMNVTYIYLEVFLNDYLKIL